MLEHELWLEKQKTQTFDPFVYSTAYFVLQLEHELCRARARMYMLQHKLDSVIERILVPEHEFRATSQSSLCYSTIFGAVA